MGLTVKVQIIAEVALPGKQAEILLAQDRLAYSEIHLIPLVS